MKTSYFDSPNAAIAVNFKAGSASLAWTIIQAHHTEVLGKIQAAQYPTDLTADNVRWHALCPKIEPAQRTLVLVPFRDPVERFRSACAESRINDPVSWLEFLEEQGTENVRDPHFWPQSRLLVDGCRLYRFEGDLNTLALDAGLETPLPTIPTRGIKPTLTDECIERIRDLYSKDLSIWESITIPGQIYQAPTDPASVEALRFEMMAHLKANRDAKIACGFEFGDKQIQTRNQADMDTIRSLAIAATNAPSFETDFITADNSILPLDAAGCVALHQAMVNAGNVVWQQYILSRDSLNAASTLKALSEINIEL
jgi:hypothetical protein